MQRHEHRRGCERERGVADGERHPLRDACAARNVDADRHDRADSDQERHERRRQQEQHRHQHELRGDDDPVAERELDAVDCHVDADEERGERE